MRTKYRRRLILLGLLLVPALAGATYVSRERRLDAEAREARVVGLSAYDNGDYSTAVRELSAYVRRLDPDALALLRYAQSICNLPNPDSAHYQSALAALRRSVGMRPDDGATREVLLGLYSRLGLFSEAIEQANWLLERSPNSTFALGQKASALNSIGRFEDALKCLDSEVGPEFPALGLQLLYLDIMASLERPGDEIRARATAVQSVHSEDPQFLLVVARAHLLAKDPQQAQDILRRLLLLGIGDVEFSKSLIWDLDRAGLSKEALDVLSGVPVGGLDQEMQGSLVRRLWELGHVDAIEAQVDRWGIGHADLPTSVLGHIALARVQLRGPEHLQEVLAVLDQRQDDSAAVGWAHLLRGIGLPEGAPPADRIEACLRALKSDSRNAQSRFELAVAFRDAGELELAVRELKAASELAISWATPAVVGARILIESGRLQAALRAAVVARARASEDPAVTLLVNLARGSTSTSAQVGNPDSVLAGLRNSGVSEVDLLPIRLAVTAAGGRDKEVQALIEEALARPGSLDGNSLIACARLSRMRGLGLEGACLERYADSHGRTPALALALASAAAASGGLQAGLKAFSETREDAESPESGAWLAAQAEFLEEYAEPNEALDAWRKVVEGAPGQAQIMRTVLGAASVWTDLELARTVIDALKLATGASGIWWKYYHARWVVGLPAPDAATVDSAIDLLRGVLEIAPDFLRARLLLGALYEVRGELRQALEQFIVARGTLGPSTRLDLRVARLHQALGDWSASRELLNRVVAVDLASLEAVTPEQQLGMAAMFARLGDKSGVLKLLARGDGEISNSELVQGRAEVYAAAGAFARAEHLIASSLSSGQNLPALQLAAALADMQGQRQQAAALLDRLQSAMPDQVLRERMLAEHFRRVEMLELAEPHLQILVGLDHSERSDWQDLLACQVLLGKVEAVVTTLALQGARPAWAANGSSGDLSEDLLRVATQSPGLRRLGAAYVKDDTYRSAAEQALRLLAASSGDESGEKARARLVALAQVYPRFLALQLSVAELLVGLGDVGEAVVVCKGAVAAFPTEPEPARMLAHCFRALKVYDRAEAAAQEWRSRTRGLPVAADLFLAEQSTPERAVALLESYVPMAIERETEDVLFVYGRALIGLGKTGQIETLLASRMVDSLGALRVWISLARFAAMHEQADVAVKWLEMASDRILSARGHEYRIEASLGWQAIADMTGSATARETSRMLVNAIRGDAEVNVQAWERIGLIREANSDTSLAEEAYRKASSAGAGQFVAMNNLAMILIRSGRGGEALQLAKTLVARRPRVSEFRDTLASAYLSEGKLEAAIDEFRENIKLDPADARWAQRILQALLDAGDHPRARLEWATFRGLYSETRMSAELKGRWRALAERCGGP